MIKFKYSGKNQEVEKLGSATERLKSNKDILHRVNGVF